MSTILRFVVLAVASMYACAGSAATAHINVLKPETCGNSNGAMQAGISGSGGAD